jgi:NADPH2:quinone reductase
VRAIAYEKFGSADVLQLTELPKPHIGPDTMVVKVVAASLNPVDYKIREGLLDGLIDVRFPIAPGWDVAGVVEQPGLDTPEFRAGDEVIAYTRRDIVSVGSLAEYTEVPVRAAAHKSAGLSFEQGAALPLAGLTALQAVRRSKIDKGATVLVHAAAGGVGTFGSQLAVLAGARVIGTASPANHDFLRSLGVEPVDYHGDLVSAANELAPHGYDVILDFVGGSALDTVGELLRPGGTVTSIADGRAADFGGQTIWARPSSQDLSELADLAGQGTIKVEIAEVFDLDRAVDAFRALESGHTRGKIIVRI